MQLEKEKKEKQERERCRALAQRIAEEAAAASAALLGEQSLLLTKALRRAGVAAEAWAEGSEAELLVVVDPAYETLPETLPARVLLVSSESTVMAGWAEQLAQRGYFRDFAFPAVGRLFGVGTHQLEIVHADDGQLKFFPWEFSACWNLPLTSSVRTPNFTISSNPSYHDFNPFRTCQND